MTSRQPFETMPASKQAGILCNDARFQRFAAKACKCPAEQVNASAAAQFVRTFCQVESRRHLDFNPVAREQFQTLRTEFDAWTGKIASPNQKGSTP